ncbi:MAG: glutamine synthetase [Alphaproteobacteria bacterium]|nr:glutamine synthetase [Alphaproteobacteria bacterium]
MNVHRSAPSEEVGASRLAAAEVGAFLTANPSVQYVDCVFVDLCGNVRGKRIASADLQIVFRSGMAVPSSIYFLDSRGDVIERLPAGAGAQGTAWPVAGSLTRVSWAQRPHGQVLMSLTDAKGEPYFGEPRNVLKRVLRRFEDFGVIPALGVEMDAYVVDRERGKDGAPHELAGVHAEFVSLLCDGIVTAGEVQALPRLSVQAEGSRLRLGFAIENDSLTAVDCAVFLRQAARAVARKEARDVLFMAQPFLGRPGSGMRMTVDLNRAGESVFSTDAGGDLVRFAVGGLQALMGESLALLAPSENAFRRFGSGFTAPRNRRWGYANPSTNISIVPGGRQAALLHRLAGADANPYLVAASVLAGIHYGIQQNLDPGNAAAGDVSALVDPTLPTTIDAALLSLENGSVMREYLEPAYVDLYCATKRTELERFHNFIPAHEYDWYA